MNKLGAIKLLKERGASYRMMDDVSDFVGGYDSPLFIPTIEFIIDMNKALSMDTPLKSAGIGMSSEQKQDNNPPLEYNPAYFLNISLEAARDHAKNMAAISSGTELEQQIHAVEYLEDMIIQENQYMKSLGVNAADELKHKKTSNNNKKQKVAQRMADKIRREMDAFMGYLNDSTKSSQRSLKSALLTNVTQQRQQQGQQGQQQNQQQQVQRRESSRRSSRIVKVVKVVLTNIGVIQPNKALQDAAKKTQNTVLKQQQAHDDHHQDHHQDPGAMQKAQQIQRDSSKQQQQKDKTKVEVKKENVKDSIFSKMIDKIVRTTKDEKKEEKKEVKKQEEVQKKDEQKRPDSKPEPQEKKFSKDLEQNRGPKANEERVAKMDMKEAIKALQDVGVKTASSPNVGEAAKKALDAQLKNQPLDSAKQQAQKPQR